MCVCYDNVKYYYIGIGFFYEKVNDNKLNNWIVNNKRIKYFWGIIFEWDIVCDNEIFYYWEINNIKEFINNCDMVYYFNIVFKYYDN